MAEHKWGVYDCSITWFSDEKERSNHVVFVSENFDVQAIDYVYDARRGYGVHILHWGKKEAETDVTNETDSS